MSQMQLSLVTPPEKPAITLRPYQEECVDAVFKSMVDGNEFGLVSIPTGGGKTVIFSNICENVYGRYEKRMDRRLRIAIVAHREQLVSQSRDKLLAVWPGSADRIGMACASYSNDVNIDADIVIASIQTLLSRLRSRGADSIDPFDLLLVDEAHRIPPVEKRSAYGELFTLTKELSHRRKVVGFTATPFRLGHGYIYGKGCRADRTNFFPKITFSESMDDMIANGYLVPYRIKRAVDIGPELRRVPIVNGEYKADVLGDIMCKFINSAVDVYLRYGENRRHVVAFCSGINHAEKLSAAFNQAGISCATVHSQLPMEERKRRLGDFSAGKINVLASVDALIEGWDETSVDCILMLRPTKSPMIYVQQGGRGLRLHKGKENLLILDMADNFENHGFLSHPKVVIPNLPMEGEVPTKICPQCDLCLHASVRICPECGHVFVTRVVEEPKKVDMEEIHVSVQNKERRGRIACQVKSSRVAEQGNVLRFIFDVLPPGSDNSMTICHWITAGDMKRDFFPVEWREMTNLSQIPQTIHEAALLLGNVRFPDSIYVNFKSDGKFFCGWNEKGWTRRIMEKKAPEASSAGFVRQGKKPAPPAGRFSVAPPQKPVAQEKTCPQCKGSILASAGICPLCGHAFMPRRISA